jgi:MerR family copper efflux transcriptional regulator
LSQELPIACSLSGPDLRDRLAEIREVGRAGLIDVRREGSRSVLRFRPSTEISGRLAHIVAAEAACCAFLALRIDEAPDAVRLTIEGPNGTEPVVDELVEAFETT